MPKIDDLKRWARGESVQSLPDRPFAKWKHIGVDLGQELHREINRDPPSGLKTTLYRISLDGKDAVLMFGRHKGRELSGLYGDDPGYLVWMLGEDFPKDLKDVIEHIRDRARKHRRDLKKLGSDLKELKKRAKGSDVSITSVATAMKPGDLAAILEKRELDGTWPASEITKEPIRGAKADFMIIDDVGEMKLK